MNTIVVALRVTLFTLVLTGILYPLASTGLAQVLFPRQANGSMLTDDKGQLVGSELIAQGFVKAAYFQPRPSAAGEKGYDATASGGSNLSTTSKKLRDRVRAELARLHEENPDAKDPVPSELLTTSASGLAPHISPEAARWQLARVAKARGVPVDRLRRLLDSQTERRGLGFLGEPRVNVLLLNLALDRQLGRPGA